MNSPVALDALFAQLRATPRTFLVTGGAGFIGSHLVEQLVALGQRVVVLDNLSTGKRENLAPFLPNITFVEDCLTTAPLDDVLKGVDVVLHQAALGSVPRSLNDPLTSHKSNVDGFIRLLWACKNANIKRFVYASSSSVYGDHPALPKVEDHIGKPLSPYAATKRIDEIYAQTFSHSYGIETVGLRYFNVFGPRQDPHGPYAAVIPRFVDGLLKGETCTINGDGETSRDFCSVYNAVQANLLAGFAHDVSGHVFNVAFGQRTTLLELYDAICQGLTQRQQLQVKPAPRFADFRPGDVRHSLADTSKAQRLLGYAPTHDIHRGLDAALDWYIANRMK